MGVDAAIFNSAGQRSEHLLPGVYSRSNNVTSPSGVSTGNLCIIGSSMGGEPKKLLDFTSLAEAKESLVSGELLDAIGYAFNANDTYIPQRIYAIRADKAKQSDLVLKSNGNNMLKLLSWDWGYHCNKLKFLLNKNTGANTYKIVVGYKDITQEVDNIEKLSLSITYGGEGTPSAVVSKDKLVLSAVDAESQAIEDDSMEIKFSDFTTLEEVVNKINDSDSYTADYSGQSSDLSSELDTGTFSFTENECSLYSNLAAIVEAIKTCTLIGDVSIVSTDGSRVVPDDTNGYVYFTNGENSSATSTDYMEALEVIQTENIQIIATPSSNQDLRNQIVEHCKEMSNVINRKERTCILGGAINEADDTAITTVKGINSKYVSYVVDSAVASNPITGKTENISGAMLGVMLAAMESAMNVNEPLTFKTLNVLGFNKKRSISNIEKLIAAGILVCNPNPENLTSYICIRGLTTNQSNDLINCERSMVREDLYMNRDLRAKFVDGIGRPNETSTTSIVQTLENAGKDWANQGLIVKNGSNNVWNISVKISGDKVYLTYSRYLTAPRNFVFITATNHVYESTVEL